MRARVREKERRHGKRERENQTPIQSTNRTRFQERGTRSRPRRWPFFTSPSSLLPPPPPLRQPATRAAQHTLFSAPLPFPFLVPGSLSPGRIRKRHAHAHAHARRRRHRHTLQASAPSLTVLPLTRGRLLSPASPPSPPRAPEPRFVRSPHALPPPRRPAPFPPSCPRSPWLPSPAAARPEPPPSSHPRPASPPASSLGRRETPNRAGTHPDTSKKQIARCRMRASERDRHPRANRASGSVRAAAQAVPEAVRGGHGAGAALGRGIDLRTSEQASCRRQRQTRCQSDPCLGASPTKAPPARQRNGAIQLPQARQRAASEAISPGPEPWLPRRTSAVLTSSAFRPRSSLPDEQREFATRAMKRRLRRSRRGSARGRRGNGSGTWCPREQGRTEWARGGGGRTRGGGGRARGGGGSGRSAVAGGAPVPCRSGRGLGRRETHGAGYGCARESREGALHDFDRRGDADAPGRMPGGEARSSFQARRAGGGPWGVGHLGGGCGSNRRRAVGA